MICRKYFSHITVGLVFDEQKKSLGKLACVGYKYCRLGLTGVYSWVGPGGQGAMALPLFQVNFEKLKKTASVL